MPSLRTAMVLALLGAATVGRASEVVDPYSTVDPTDEARQAFREGVTLVKKAQWAEALLAFERSARLRPHPTTTFSIGACERALGRYVRAGAAFRRALSGSAPGQ